MKVDKQFLAASFKNKFKKHGVNNQALFNELINDTYHLLDALAKQKK